MSYIEKIQKESQKLRLQNDSQYKDLWEIIDKYKHQSGTLLPILQEAQGKFGYLSHEVALRVAEGTNLPLSRVYEVATFYSLLATELKGEVIIRICESAPCHVNGFKEILDAFEQELGIKVGETTKDGKFTLEFTSCLGACDISPVVMFNQEVYGNLTIELVKDLIRKYSQ